MSRKLNQQLAFEAYLNKWNLKGYNFAIPGRYNCDYMLVLPEPMKEDRCHGNLNLIRSAYTLVNVGRRVKTVKLYVGELVSHPIKYGPSYDFYRYFNSWNEFLEYNMIVRLAGL